MDIAGKNILVAGGLGGLGAALADDLREAGAWIYIFDRAESDRPGVSTVDLADESAVAEALERIDRVDALINCAGEIYSEPLINVMKKERHGRESWDRVLAANLTTCFTLGVQVAQKMAQARVRGVIINFSSIAARGNAGQAAYSAAKAGVEAFTAVLAREMGLFGIRAVAVAPGFVDTPSTRASMSEERLDYWLRKTPLRRLGRVDDIVKTVRYILECDHVSGRVIAVDGALNL